MTGKYQQIAAVLEREIREGVHTVRFPSEADLAKRFATTGMTVRKALEVLAAKRLIYKVPYVGTFVGQKQERELRIYWPIPHNSGFFQELGRCVQSRFPSLRIRFEHDPALAPECDLICSRATFAGTYTDSVMPYPAELVERFRSAPDYFQEPFETHRIGRHTYALPVLFSPMVLNLNAEAAAWNIQFPEPSSLDYGSLAGIGAEARKHGGALWDLRTAGFILLCQLFSCGNGSGRLASLPPDAVRDVFSRFRKLWRFCAFREETPCVFSAGVRQNGDSPGMLFQFPLPWCGLRRYSLMSGDFLLLSNGCRQVREAIDAAAAFLSPEVQKVVASWGMGLPVLKYAAVDSLTAGGESDAVYLQACGHLLTNNASEQAMRLRFFAQFGALQPDGAGLDELERYVLSAIGFARSAADVRSPNIQKRLMAFLDL